MIIVGHERSATGALSYLVQNSWERVCPFSDPAIAAQKGVSCELEDGGPTGRFWISGTTLLKNTFGVDFLVRTTSPYNREAVIPRGADSQGETSRCCGSMTLSRRARGARAIRC